MTISDLSKNEYDPYYGRYILKLSPTVKLKESYEMDLVENAQFFTDLPANKHSFRYREDKWTVKEVMQHLIDTERIFMYRCFRIARRDLTSLAGFDQTVYNQPSKAHDKSIEQLILEFQCGRHNSIAILESLSSDDLAFIGLANEAPMSARAAAFTIIGHNIWHREIITERYL